MARRRRSDSVAAGLAAFAAAGAGGIEPPDTIKLRKGDRAYWDVIVHARARDEWSLIDLHHAANLARCLADSERLANEIAVDGDLLTNDRGTRVANPKHAILETLSRRGVALTRLLHLHASVLNGRPEEVAKGRETEHDAKQTVRDMDDDGDDLLARPSGSRLQ